MARSLLVSSLKLPDAVLCFFKNVVFENSFFLHISSASSVLGAHVLPYLYNLYDPETTS